MLDPSDREALLDRKAVLLRLYQEPESDEQLVEVLAELEAIAAQLRGEPAPARRTPASAPREDRKRAAAGDRP